MLESNLEFLSRCDFNLVALAGGARDIAEFDTSVALQHIHAAVELNGKPTVIKCIDFRYWEQSLCHFSNHAPSGLLLTSHHDCGACGGSARFGHDEAGIAEVQFHLDLLDRASRRTTDKMFGRHAVRTFFASSLFSGHDAKTCDTMVVTCSESSHWQNAFRIVRSRGIKLFDIFAAPGGAGKLMRERTFADHLIANIKIAKRLHHIQSVILTGHASCVATAGDLVDAYEHLTSVLREDDIKVSVLHTDRSIARSARHAR